MFARQAHAQIVQVAKWQAYFDSAGVTGAVLLFEPNQGLHRTSDTSRARESYIPASTFKIFSTMALLESGVVDGPDDTVPWDAQDRCIADWNRNLTLRQAYHASAFWVYQRLVRQLGRERTSGWLQQARYGNARMTAPIDRFWLDGDLRISMLEQIDFLQRLQLRQLPFSARTVDITQDVMIEERRTGYVLRGKTGWARQLSGAGERFADCRPSVVEGVGPNVWPEIGWYVGYVTRSDRTVYFALLVEIRKPSDAAHRRSIVRRLLADERVIDAPPR
jgi:beta-lactamase class D